MTGDSLNDARALEFADVGFAMQGGCEVTKDNADIITMDNSFKSTIDSVRFGRNVYNNVRKFLQYQMTINIVALSCVFLSGIVTAWSCFTVIQLLWINLVMDTLAALSLATEPPRNNEIQGKPTKIHHNIMTPVMWRTILAMAIYQFVVMIVMIFATPAMFGMPNSILFVSPITSGDRRVYNTIVLNTFMFMTIFNQFSCRKLGIREFNFFSDFFNNFYFIAIFLGIVLAQLVLSIFGNNIFQTAPLTYAEWATCILIGLSVIPVAIGIRATPEHLL